MPTVVPELADRCVVLNGVAKTYAMTGWRVGWMIGPLDVIGAATNLQSHSTSNVSNVAQRAALAAVSGDLVAVAEMRAAFDRRRKIMAMLKHPGHPSPDRRGLLRLPVLRRGPGAHHRRPRRPPTDLELSAVILDEAGWRSSPARPSAHPATPGSPSPSATTT